MEMTASGAEGAKILEGGTDVSKSTIPGSGGIESAKQRKTGWFGLTSKSSKEEQKQHHLGQGLIRTTWWEKVGKYFSMLPKIISIHIYPHPQGK
jgi:hypothetical protein